MEQVGWFYDNDGKETREVGLKFPNQLGIYDMIGNVYEWCWDWYGDYDKDEMGNPLGAKTGSSRVIRGGGWYYDAESCRIVDRRWDDAGFRSGDFGFRIALSL